MTKRTWTRLALRLFAALLVASIVEATEEEPLSLVGLTLADQHGTAHYVSVNTRTVVFTNGMNASKIVRKLLDERPPDWLARHHAIFVADVHRMPRLITRFVALPRLRRNRYPILLIRDDETAADWPRQEDMVTILTLTKLPVETVRYTSSADELETWIVSGNSLKDGNEAAGDAPAAP